MALRDKTPQDLPASQKFGWWMIPFASTVTRDANGLLQSVENSFDNGSRPCGTTDATKRHTISKVNGYDCAVSTDTSRGGILLQNMTGIPSGNADLCMIFIQMPQDGVVGGFRGGNNYWVDNPYPDYRMRTEKGDFTGSGTTNNTSLHTLIINRKNGVTTMRVDGTTRGTQAPSGGYNTTLGTFGIKGADANYYVLKGATLGAMLLKQAASDDDIYFFEAYFARYTGQAIPSDNPYRTALPQVDDGTTPATITGSASGTLAGLGTVAASSIAILGAAALTLGAIGGTQTASAPIAAQAQASLGGITPASVSTAPLSAASSATLGGVTGTSTSSAPVAATASAQFSPIASASAATAPITGAAAQPLGSVSTASGARSDMTATAASTLAPITASATGHAETPGGATAESTLSPVGSTASGHVIATGNAAAQLGAITAASAGAIAARAAAAGQLGAIGSAAAGSSAIGAVAATPIGSIAAAARVSSRIAATASVTLAPVGGTATATARGETADHVPSPGWARTVQPRSFTGTVARRNFHPSSTGSSRMISFPPKYADEVRHASVDFTPDLGEGETLVGAPTVTPSGDVVAESARIDDGKVLFTLRGGSADVRAVQRLFVTVETSHGQTLGEVALLTVTS